MNYRAFEAMGLGLLALTRALGAQPAAPPAGWEWRPVAPVASPLRILVQYDMEGLSGVDRLAMVQCATSAYAAGVDRLVADVNAVIEGLSQAHVARIDVIDRHGSGVIRRRTYRKSGSIHAPSTWTKPRRRSSRALRERSGMPSSSSAVTRAQDAEDFSSTSAASGSSAS